MTKQIQIQKRDSWKLFDEIATTYDFINHFLSLGIDIQWRKKLLSLVKTEKNLHALDLATGTADIPLNLVTLDNIDKVTGLDLSKEMIEHGNLKIKKYGYQDKIKLKVACGVEVPLRDESVDLVTISFGIRNFSNVECSLQNIHRVLKPGGQLLIMEFGLPKNPIVRHSYLFYFRFILPFIGKILSKHPYAYSYLNRTVETFPYGEEFANLMRKAGFKKVNVHPLTFGVANIYCGYKD